MPKLSHHSFEKTKGVCPGCQKTSSSNGSYYRHLHKCNSFQGVKGDLPSLPSVDFPASIDPKPRTLRTIRPNSIALDPQPIAHIVSKPVKSKTEKSFSQFSPTYQRQILQPLANGVANLLRPTLHPSIKTIGANLTLYVDQQPYQISINNLFHSDHTVTIESPSALREQRQLKDLVFVQDLTQASQRSTRYFAKVVKEIPREGRILIERNAMNQKIDEIFEIRLENAVAFRRRVIDGISFFSKVFPFQTEEVIFKFSGDGRRVGKKWTQVVATLSFLQHYSAATSPHFLYTLVAWDGVEKREQMKIAMEKTLKEIKELKETGFVDASGRKYTVKIFFCADWKFMALLFGIVVFFFFFSWLKSTIKIKNQLI